MSRFEPWTWLADVIRSPVAEYLETVHDEYRSIRAGAVADYIPELAKADPDWFGIVLATVDGEIYEVGDTAQDFTIQSVSKPFAYGAMLDEHGHAAVEKRVGVEPTGNAFNAILVDEGSRRPFNPMVNAGAIVTTGLAPGYDADERRAGLFGGLSRFAGRPLVVDQVVYESEHSTGHRNRALAHLMRSYEMLDDVDAALDLYFEQCSLIVTARDLAVMAATLANAGVNPITGERVIHDRNVERVLSVMSSCGMYDYAGEWDYTVGLPAKSGVSGGLIAVLPGQLAISVFSPPLDARGNTVRGIAVCQRLSRDLELHGKRARRRGASAVRRTYSGAEVRSTRVRPEGEQVHLSLHGHRLAVFELQGDLMFSNVEPVHRIVVDSLEGVEYVILDFRRVGAIDAPAARVLRGIVEALEESGRTVVLTYVDETETRYAEHLEVIGARTFDVTDTALHWFEEQLLTGELAAAGTELAGQELLRGLSEDELAAVARATVIEQLAPGDLVIREGEEADTIYFLLEGVVSVRLHLEGVGRTRTVASFGPGVAFGEAALLDERERSADVRAEGAAVVAGLPLVALEALEQEFGGIKAKMLANVARVLAVRLRAANSQIRALEH
jgi:glutaminase